MESSIHPTGLASIYLLGMLIIGSFIQWTFLLKLKKYHAGQWEQAGKPTIFTCSSDPIFLLSTFKYVWSPSWS